MKMSSRFVLNVVIIVAVSVLVASAASFYQLNEAFDTAEERELRAQHTQFSASVQSLLDSATSRSALVAEIPSVQQALAKQDRDVLGAMFVPGFSVMKKDYGVGQFQFHLPPATSFLRVHKAKKFGDDLSGFRKTILKTNKTQKPVSGLERGRAGLGARGLTPIFYDGKHVGSVEFGLSFKQPFFDAYKARTGADIAFYLLPDANVKNFDGKDQKSMTLAASTFGKDSIIAEEDIRAGVESAVYVGRRDLDGGTKAILTAPVRDFSGNTQGVVVIGISTAVYESLGREALISVVIAGLLCLILGGVVAYFSGQLFTRPILALSGTMGELASGNLDAEVPGSERTDEIGGMAEAVQVFKDSGIARLRLEAEQEQSKVRVEKEKQQALNALAQEFQSNVGGVVEAVTSASTELQASAQSMSTISEKNSSQATAVSAASEEASGSVQTVAAAAEELSSSISEISRQVQQSTKITGTAVSSAQQADEMVQGLAQSAIKIGEVVELITDIADQTNLLALNATIEAARAGDAGKGFAVVASEVKNLANQTAKATEEIGGQIAGIQVATQGSVDAIQGIGKTINEIDEISSAIAAAVEEQGAATSEIARNVEQAASSTSVVSSNILGVTQSTGEAGQSANQVLSAATGLSDQSEILKTEVDKFLAHVHQS